MNFNVYVDRQTGERLARLAKARRTTRNALIRQALAHMLGTGDDTGWPEAVLAYAGEPNLPRFETTRGKLRSPRRDPFS